MAGETSYLRRDIKARNEVWDTGSLDWVAMTQPVVNTDSLTISGTVTVGNFPTSYPVTDNGGSLTVDGTVSAPQYDLKVYSDASYDYFCHAAPGTALSASGWRVKRMDADGSMTFAGGAATFVNPATNLATVQGLFP